MPRQIKRFGWIPDLPDHRDRRLSIPLAQPLPKEFDTAADFPPVYDQGNLGGCVAHGVKGIIEHQRKRQSQPFFDDSRLFVYFGGRKIEGDTSADSGLMVRDGIKSVLAFGTCPESEWPYDVGQFATEPPAKCYADARKHGTWMYSRITPTLYNLKFQIAHNMPFTFGFSVYDSFMSDVVASTGIMPMPASSEAVIGGHCVCGVGFSDARGAVKCRNSWSSAWGDPKAPGYFWMPYAYITDPNLCDDFWEIRWAS